MVSVDEIFQAGSKGSAFGMSTYSSQEAGLDLSYKIDMVIHAKVENLSAKEYKKLLHHLTTLGDYSCKIDKRNNTISVHCIDGLNRAGILSYVKKKIDSDARGL